MSGDDRIISAALTLDQHAAMDSLYSLVALPSFPRECSFRRTVSHQLLRALDSHRFEFIFVPLCFVAFSCVIFGYVSVRVLRLYKQCCFGVWNNVGYQCTKFGYCNTLFPM